jgi:hypothetical protein
MKLGNLGRMALIAIATLNTAYAGSVKASSEATDSDGLRHAASLAVDGLLSTAWAEGEVGDGEGQWLELRLDRATDIESVSFWPGDMAKGARSARESGRPKMVTVSLGSGADAVSAEMYVPDVAEAGLMRIDVPIQGRSSVVRLTLDDVYGGFIHNDTYIAEVAVNFAAGDKPAVVASTRDWAESGSGKALADKAREDAIALFDRIDTSDLGDREAMMELMDRAGDGAPFMRKRVASSVPVGYRITSLAPDSTSIQALLKLKDPNAIPALEFAALRSVGKAEREYLARVEMFSAYADLVGGARVNLSLWGESGWEKGALRGLGEPLALDIDQYGNVFVADIGNHRIQRFRRDGVADAVWGDEPDITNEWFDGKRAFYAAGATPSTEPGRFHTPVDVAVIPGKDSDMVAVLDSQGRVQVFDANGQVLYAFEIAGAGAISAGVGSEGHLVWLKKKLVVIWGNEGYLRGLDGEDLGEFKIEDGVPRGAVGFSNGKVGLMFGKNLVTYSLDGFRHEGVLGDELGGGFEGWAVALDGKGKLWAVTDDGYAIKYKRPGQVDFRIQFASYSIETPRLAVQDDVLFISHGDEIMRVDALELQAQAELAEADGEAP